MRLSGVRASLVAAAGAFGLAWCIAWLFLGTRTLMFMLADSGRSSMTGPWWIWIVPVSIVAGFAFGALNAWASGRAEGMVVARCGWTGLFWSLALNFVQYGIRARDGGAGIAMLVVGVLFLALGAVPLPIGQRDFEAGWPIPRVTGRPSHIALSILGALAGVAAAVSTFAALTR